MADAPRPDHADVGAEEAQAEERSAQVAVIDVGSNSVRLIVYRRVGRAFWPIFNEKLLAGLGRGVAETGRLSPEGVDLALRTLRRFRMILDARGVDETHAFATAAVREAADGPQFIAHIAAECGFMVETLSGAEEARLSALGVVAGGAGDGLVGDLGGSSLELCAIRDGAPGLGETLRLGPLAVLDGKRDRRAIRKIIDAELDRAEPLLSDDTVDFYAVGGAWRSLARIDMALRGYPLPVLHHYTMTRARARAMAEFVAGQSPDSLEDVEGISSRRVALLPYAALLLDGVLRRGRFRRVIVSAYGVREGALFDRMAPNMRARDPLLAGAAAFARRLAPASTVGESLSDWIEPAFKDDVMARETLLRRAAALLADMGSAMHPDHRADLVADQVLYAPFAGLDHSERAFLATALFHRYRGPSQPPADFAPGPLLASEEQERARSLGLALRLGCVVSGRTPTLLKLTSIETGDGKLRLNVRDQGAALITDQAQKRLKHLASALGLKPEIANA